METNIEIEKVVDKFKVLTVPMRNGNRVGEGIAKEGCGSSYRTYEEWKHKNTVSI